MKKLLQSLALTSVFTIGTSLHALPDWQEIKKRATDPQAISFAVGAGLITSGATSLRTAQNESDYIVSAALLAGGTLSLSVFLALPTEEAPSFATRATQEATRLQILAAQRKLIKVLEQKQATSQYMA